MYAPGHARHHRGGGARGHQPSGSKGGSISGRTAELTSAYASLATELTRKEIKAVGAYTLGRVIGEGSFGKVHIGVHRLTNTRVAIKQVPKSIPFSSDPSSPLSLLTREIHHHRRMRHPHVLALFELIATESSIYLVSELCTGGELFDYLVEKGRLSVSETRRIFGQLVLGVAHLHRCGVVHRDLKLENVLLDERVNVKIADLGFGREFEKGRWMDTWVGSLGYSAPEMVAAKRYLGEEVDIWSLGVILFTLLAGSLPFDDDDEAVMKEKILACDFDIPTWLDEDAADLIHGILQLDPLRRLSLKAILSHKFFTRPSDHPVTDPSVSPPISQTPSFALPAPIPEEAGTPEQDAHHPLMASNTSDASFFSASDSDFGMGHRSGATTPITSEDGSTAAPPPPMTPSANRLGKQKAEDQESEANLRLMHRNVSETTIRKDSGDESGASSSEATPRVAGKGRSTLPTSKEEDDGDEEKHGAIYANHLGLSAPQLHRNVSSSSAGSFGSQGGSPVPVHTRTPSRTKRHSFGSMFSERLFSLDEEPASVHIDYVALLEEPIPAPLSTTAEKTLLDGLTTLGFDTGQMVHSVMTDACDASGATWWMLKRKADERARERQEAEHVNDSILAKTERTKPTPTLQHAFPTPPSGLLMDPSHSPSESEDGSLSRSVSHSPERAPTIGTPDSNDRDAYFLGHFLGASGSVSAPLLPYFPPVEVPPSPTPKTVLHSKSKENLTAAAAVGTPSPSAFHTSTSSPLLPPSSLTDSPNSGHEGDSSFKSKRVRSASVSMLQRATSALGGALKKPTDGLRDEFGRSEDGRSTPTLAGLFHRKSSLPDDLRVTSPPGSPDRYLETDTSSSSPATPNRKSVSRISPQASPAISHSDSHDTFDTITSNSSSHLPTASNTPAKKSSRGNLFSNFKMWFGDDRRKRKRQSPSHVESSASVRNSTLRRGVRPEGNYINSPLKKPPLGSRRSSNGSLAPVSRRSSITSVSRGRPRDTTLISPHLGHRRRQSDSSRASTSDLEHSRPPSVRSLSGNAESTPHRRGGHHSKSNSISSSTSFRPHVPVTAKDVYRRPPTSTTVRRHHGSSSRHSRNRSGGSSITRHSSSSSIGAEDALGEEPKSSEAILEEDETGDEDRYSGIQLVDEPNSTPRSPEEEKRASEERARALRKLSGEFVSAASQSHEELHRSRGSRTSLESHHSNGRHSPVIFAAHKTRHVFGAPSQPVAQSSSAIGRKLSNSTVKPPLRDVFAAKEGDGDWIDEEDLGGYGGGLGQASTRAGQRPDSASSGTTSPGSSLFSSASSVLSTIPSSAQSDRDSFDYKVTATSSIFESRYAGVSGAAHPQAEANANALWRSGGQGSRPPAFRSAVVIEEEEEDD